jgi:hypothetical protein
MALGHAAGIAAGLSIRAGLPPRQVDVRKIQRRLLEEGAVLIYFQDARPGDQHYEALQLLALRGFLDISEWQANLEQPVKEAIASRWIRQAAAGKPESYQPGKTTRGELLEALYRRLRQK